MTTSTRRVAAVILAVAVSIPSYGAPRRDYDDVDFRHRVVEIVKKFQKLLVRTRTQSDLPAPPKP